MEARASSPVQAISTPILVIPSLTKLDAVKQIKATLLRRREGLRFCTPQKGLDFLDQGSSLNLAVELQGPTIHLFGPGLQP